MNQLSANLKILLSHANISENELARRTGIAQQIINRILSGENTNPKIATLKPLSNYFMISLSQLIGDVPLDTKVKLNVNHLGFKEIPLIAFDLIEKNALNDLIIQSKEKLRVDIDALDPLFAIQMNDDSMEPKFSKNSILILKYCNTTSFNGDFGLIQLSNDKIELRQLFQNDQNTYKKCLNPSYDDYHVTLINSEFTCLGLLIQSRTNFLTK